MAEHASVDEARLRISVRREATGGKAEVKIGYIDVSKILLSNNYKSFKSKAVTGPFHGTQEHPSRRPTRV